MSLLKRIYNWLFSYNKGYKDGKRDALNGIKKKLEKGLK